ncbi:MAG TPA: DUF1015 domain-containing protein [Mycobacteriales bacterium]|nr:DUF1015 domain-containing protein [Mycobacteriales bacterium]
MTTHHSPAPSSPPSPDGLSLRPFRALRYADPDPARLALRLCPPYDVIDDAERSALERADPHNAVRLILPRPPAGSRPSDPAAGPGSADPQYQQAARLLRDWQRSGILHRDPAPGVYVYEIGTTRGLIGALALAAPDAGIILPHENTMPGPVADRLALTEATQSNLEPIFCVYDGTEQTAALLGSVDALPPLAEATTPDGVRHRLWSLTDPAQLDRLDAALHPLRAVIADGHHRYATYLQHQRDRHAAGAGPGPWDFGLTFLVDARRFGPAVEAIHRVIPGLDYERAVGAAGRGFRVTPIEGSVDTALGRLREAGREGTAFVITDGTAWSLLTHPDREELNRVLPEGPGAAWRTLEVTVAHQYLIGRLWSPLGLTDTAETVLFQHDAAAAVRQVTGGSGVVLLLNPTPVEQVARVAAEGDRMPRKSTLFEPKPRTGMLFRPFAPA